MTFILGLVLVFDASARASLHIYGLVRVLLDNLVDFAIFVL